MNNILQHSTKESIITMLWGELRINHWKMIDDDEYPDKKVQLLGSPLLRIFVLPKAQLETRFHVLKTWMFLLIILSYYFDEYQREQYFCRRKLWFG